jgi:hypothetical protein
MHGMRNAKVSNSVSASVYACADYAPATDPLNMRQVMAGVPMSTESPDPAHYKNDSWEAIDVIKDVLTKADLDPQDSYYLGAALKYLLRIGRKDDYKTEAKKAIIYLGWLVDGRKK